MIKVDPGMVAYLKGLLTEDTSSWHAGATSMAVLGTLKMKQIFEKVIV
jgi:hypothetical protein